MEKILQQPGTCDVFGVAGQREGRVQAANKVRFGASGDFRLLPACTSY